MWRFIAVDTETLPFRPGNYIPDLICCSWDAGREGAGVELAEPGCRRIMDWLRDPHCCLIFHFAPYDIAVLMRAGIPFRLFRDAGEAGRLSCTKTRQRLIDIAEGQISGGYSLKDLAQQILNVELNKNEDIRTGFWKVQHQPPEEWDKVFYQYAIEDAIATRNVWKVQQMLHGGGFREEGPWGHGIALEHEVLRSEIGLHLMSCWGLRTDAQAVEALRKALDKECFERSEKLATTTQLVTRAGAVKINLVRQRVIAAYAAQRLPVPMSNTEKNVSVSWETLAESGDQELEALASLIRPRHLRTTFLPLLEAGIKVPINCRYEIAESLRALTSKPSLQNLPRPSAQSSFAKNVRPCFVPRPEFLFASVDYEAHEMRTFAQCAVDIVGTSSLATALRQNRDPHLWLARGPLQQTYEQLVEARKRKDLAVEQMRQLMKIGNFGILGSMTPPTLVRNAKKQDVKMALEQAQQVEAAFHREWPEVQQVWNWVREKTGDDQVAIQHPRTGSRRGEMDFGQAANWLFQHLAAVVTRKAAWDVCCAAYDEPTSPLYGSRPVLTIHDEILAEVPEEYAHEATMELCNLMSTAEQHYCPDIPPAVAPALMRRWYKGAKETRTSTGRLMPWEPEGYYHA